MNDGMDINVGVMAVYLSFLEAVTPITKELDRWGSDFKSQREHVVRWLLKQPMSDANAKAFTYTRKVGNTSTRTMYNHFMNPGGLLWIAEALGASEDELMRAVRAAIDAEKDNYRKRCVAFRKVIPFDRIMELFNSRSGWEYDDRVFPLLWFDADGAPQISPRRMDKFMFYSQLGITAQRAGRYNYAVESFASIAKPKPKPKTV